jgi:hypothetical protein
MLFRVVEIRFGAHIVLDRPTRTCLEDFVEILLRDTQTARLTGAGRYISE